MKPYINMEVKYLYDILNRRDELSKRFPGLIGRHAFYNERRPLVIEGLALLEKGPGLHAKRLSEIATTLLKARASEKASHMQRMETESGNKIHDTEYELYSFAFDAFQTAADHEKLRISVHN